MQELTINLPKILVFRKSAVIIKSDIVQHCELFIFVGYSAVEESIDIIIHATPTKSLGLSGVF